jgi:hypothetical protein
MMAAGRIIREQASAGSAVATGVILDPLQLIE